MALNIFDPSNGRMRSYWENRVDANSNYIPGLPPADLAAQGSTDWCPNSEGLTTETGEIRSEAIGCPGSDISKGTTGGPVQADCDFEMLFPWLAIMQGAARNPTVLTAAQSFRHILAKSETDIEFPLSRYMRVARDDGFIESMFNVQPSQIQITWGVSQFVQVAVQLVFERSSEWDVAEVVAESGSPERPYLRGGLTYTQRQVADKDIYVRVANAGTGEIEVKVGAASAYSNSFLVSPGSPGTWVQVEDESGADLGDISNPTEIYVGSIAGWTNADEWVFRADARNIWTPSFPLLLRANEIDMQVLLEGTEIGTESGTLTIDNPRELKLLAGGLFPKGIKSGGSRAITGQLVLDYDDKDLRDRKVTGEPFNLEIILGSRTNIGSSTDTYRMSLYMPKAKFTGPTPTLASASDYSRDFSFSAEDDSTDPLPDDLTATIDNSIADAEQV